MLNGWPKTPVLTEFPEAVFFCLSWSKAPDIHVKAKTRYIKLKPGVILKEEAEAGGVERELALEGAEKGCR